MKTYFSIMDSKEVPFHFQFFIAVMCDHSVGDYDLTFAFTSSNLHFMNFLFDTDTTSDDVLGIVRFVITIIRGSQLNVIKLSFFFVRMERDVP